MSITVFLADDHDIVRQGVQSLLEAQGDIEITGTANNGRDAVRQVSQLRPDIAILDIAMPQLNGLDAAQQIRRACPAVQIIILSMYATTEHIFHALQVGARGYLLKETAVSEVVDAVRAVLVGRLYLSQKISDKVINDYISHRQAAKTIAPLSHLSGREREVLQLVAEGKTSTEIAGLLSISPRTVDTHRARLMEKLNLDGLPQLVKFAIQHGLTPLE